MKLYREKTMWKNKEKIRNAKLCIQQLSQSLNKAVGPHEISLVLPRTNKLFLKTIPTI